jgi:hypothetical protein
METNIMASILVVLACAVVPFAWQYYLEIRRYTTLEQ